MDELELISRFREEDSSPDVDAKLRVRAHLMETIAASVPPSVRTHGLTSRGHREPRHLLRAGFKGRVRTVLVAAAAAVAIALVIPLVLPGESSNANASAALLRLSQIAGSGAGWESPAKGQYIYTRSVGESPSCDENGCVLVRFTRESWIARDGSGRIVESRGSEHSDQTFGPGELPFDDLTSTLGPDYLDRLRAYVEEHMATNQPHVFAMFEEICTLLGETQAVPEQRLGLFRLAATLPDTELLGSMTDELGRVGIGIGYTSGGIRHEVIFSRDTALVLQERDVAVSPADGSSPSIGVDGVAGSWTAYVSGLVNSLNERL